MRTKSVRPGQLLNKARLFNFLLLSGVSSAGAIPPYTETLLARDQEECPCQV